MVRRPQPKVVRFPSVDEELGCSRVPAEWKQFRPVAVRRDRGESLVA